MVSTDVKNISCWIKEDSREAISCPESSALGFWRIYLRARSPLSSSLCWSSAFVLWTALFPRVIWKRFCLPSLFSDQREHYRFTKHPLFLPVSQHLCLTRIFSRGEGLGPTLLGSTASPGTSAATEVFCTGNQKIVPKLRSSRKSCLVWSFGPPNISGGTPLNGGSSLRDQSDPLSFVCTVGKKGIKGIKM